MLPPKRLIWATRYSRSNISRASRSAQAGEGGAEHAAGRGAVRRHRRATSSSGSIGAVLRAEDQRALERVAELADVARPAHRLELRLGLRRERRAAAGPGWRSARRGSAAASSGMSSRRASRPGTRDRHHVQPVVELGAEAAGLRPRGRGRGWSRRSRGRRRARCSAPPTRWKAWSTRTRRIFDWVPAGMSATSSKKRMPVWARSKRPGLDAALGALAAEEHLLHLLGRDRGGVHRDERALGALGVAVEVARRHLLAGAGRAGQHHPAVGARHLVELALHLAEGGARADHRRLVGGSPPLSAAFSRRRREVSSARPITTISWSMLNGFSMKS